MIYILYNCNPQINLPRALFVHTKRRAETQNSPGGIGIVPGPGGLQVPFGGRSRGHSVEEFMNGAKWKSVIKQLNGSISFAFAVSIREQNKLAYVAQSGEPQIIQFFRNRQINPPTSQKGNGLMCFPRGGSRWGRKKERSNGKGLSIRGERADRKAQRAFCQAKKLSYWSFRYWKKRIENQEADGNPEFVEIVAPPKQSPVLLCNFLLNNGL